MIKLFISALMAASSISSFCQTSTVVEDLGPTVNSNYREEGPLVSADGKRLYFVVGAHPDNNQKKSFEIWYSEMGKDGKWGKAVHAPFPLNQAKDNQVYWVSSDGNKILIEGFYEDGKYKGRGVSFSTKTPTGWSVPVGQKIKNYAAIAKRIGTLGRNVFMTNDSKMLLLSFRTQVLYPRNGLFYSQLEPDGSWSEPKSLGKIFESRHIDCSSPFLAADGITLYFAAYIPGGSELPGGTGLVDIYMCRRLDDTWQNWSAPVNLGPPINTLVYEFGPSLDASGEYIYFTTRDEYGDDDIVRAKLPESLRPKTVVLVYGNVYNSKTKEPISAGLLYESLPDGKNVGNAYSSSIDGSYKLVLPYGKNYSFRASAGNFFAISENLDLSKIDRYNEIKKDLYLVPIEKGETIRLNSIFFDLGKATLRAESFPELDRLFAKLQENPKLEIEISGHTDNVGNDAANVKLSEDRAKAVTTYLSSKGISVNRIIAKGYGKTKPVATNDTEEGRQLNRRVEFTILKY